MGKQPLGTHLITPYDMNFVFNELSVQYVAQNIIAAHEWLNIFFKICDQSQIRSKQNVSIRSTVKFSHIFFHPETSFSNWIRSLHDIDFKRRILLMITKEPLRLDYPYYYYQDNRCQGLGHACENKFISVSYGAEFWDYPELKITRERFNKMEEVEKHMLFVKHMSSLKHLDIHIPIRRFRPNPKHDRSHPIANKGEEVSILECSDERAFFLLCGAIGEKDPNDKQLYNYDNEAQKFIVFYRHVVEMNEYHGYHTKNKSEIPQSIIQELKNEFNF